MSFVISTWHGEGQTLWYIVEEGNREEDWEIIKTFSSREHTRQEAEDYLDDLIYYGGDRYNV